MFGNSKRFWVQLLLPICHQLSKRITTHDVHGWAVQNDITWPYVHLLTVGWSSDSKSQKVWGGQVAPHTTHDFTHVAMVWFQLKIRCKCVMLGPSIRSIDIWGPFFVKQIRFPKEMHTLYMHAIFKSTISNKEDVQCHWAISTAAIQLLIGVGHRDNRMDPAKTPQCTTPSRKIGPWCLTLAPGFLGCEQQKD